MPRWATVTRPGRGDTVGTPDLPLTIASVARGVAGRISETPQMWLTGEILSLSTSSAGVFLTLTDPVPAGRGSKAATLTCRLEVSLLRAMPIAPQRGNQIVALAQLTYWSGKGQVAASLRDVRLAGEGAVLERIELLRLALRREGLFDADRKVPPPPLPRVIGLVTGKDTHAESDVVTRARERWPEAAFRTVHTAVQGPTCAPQVVAALRQLDADPEVDVIVIARGGGSVSDLAPFSDESLVRAVAACRTPVVSAIGHEPDHPILDDVADVRAATPTHAAALVVVDVVGALRDLERLLARARRAVTQRVRAEESSLAAVSSRPVLAAPTTVPDAYAREVAEVEARLRTRVRTTLTLAQSSLDSTAATLTALSPYATLARGYAVVRRADGAPLGPVERVEPGTGLDIRTADGHLAAVTVEPPPAVGPDPAPGRGEQP